MSGKRIMPCPACRENGSDKSGDHLSVFTSGKFACAVHPGDKAHNRRIIELMPDFGKDDTFQFAQSKHATRAVDLLTRIKSSFPASLYDLWDSSPIRHDEDLDDAKMFLRLFPADAVLWIAPDIFQTGKPEHAKFFRTRVEWEAETFSAPGTRIAPSSFKPGSYRRSASTVAQHLFTVIESDEIGEGKLYADKDEFCSLVRWLHESCAWSLAAVVDSGRRSLHAWFRYPGATDVAMMVRHAAALGIDGKFSEPSQPWRLPGVKREAANTRQQIFYLGGGL